eukprot:2885622-Rhodomonas_salina.1
MTGNLRRTACHLTTSTVSEQCVSGSGISRGGRECTRHHGCVSHSAPTRVVSALPSPGVTVVLVLVVDSVCAEVTGELAR